MAYNVESYGLTDFQLEDLIKRENIVSLFKQNKFVSEDKEIVWNELLQHVRQVQDRACVIFPYPCIKTFRFITARMQKCFFYQDVLQEISWKNSSFLDIGCCMGTDLRKLMEDVGKINPDNISIFTGLDLEKDFVSLGTELFGDANNSSIRYCIGNMLETSAAQNDLPEKLQLLRKSFHFVYAGSVIHLFNEAEICLFVKRITLLLVEGGTFIGRHLCASDLPGLSDTSFPDWRKPRFIHSIESFTDLLKSAGFSDITVKLCDINESGVLKGHKFMEFIAKI